MRDKPTRLGPKLKAIRERLGVSPTGIKRFMNYEDRTRESANENCEKDTEHPVLLSYARVAGIPLEPIVDDELELSL